MFSPVLGPLRLWALPHLPHLRARHHLHHRLLQGDWQPHKTGNQIRQKLMILTVFFSQIKSFKSNFTPMLHRYICHICDIMQLWIDSVGRFPMSAKTQKDKDGKLLKAGIVESLWKRRPENKVSMQLWQLWQSRKWKTDRMFKPGTSCLGCSSMFYLPCCLVSYQFNICDSALVSVVSTLVSVRGQHLRADLLKISMSHVTGSILPTNISFLRDCSLLLHHNGLGRSPSANQHSPGPKHPKNKVKSRFETPIKRSKPGPKHPYK